MGESDNKQFAALSEHIKRAAKMYFQHNEITPAMGLDEAIRHFDAGYRVAMYDHHMADFFDGLLTSDELSEKLRAVWD